MKLKMYISCKYNNYNKPRRAHWFDAGLDCYAATIKTIKPGETAKIPLGFSLEIPHGNVVLLTPRSSLNAKDLVVRLGTIDADYSGEIVAIVHNASSVSFDIDFNTKICQLIMLPIHEIEPVVASEFDEYDNRKSGGFGSTDKNKDEKSYRSAKDYKQLTENVIKI